MISASHPSTFVHDVEALLARIEATVLALEATPADAALLDGLAGAWTALKAAAGAAGVATIFGFTHHVETALARVRSGAIGLKPALVSALLAARDHAVELLAAALRDGEFDAERGEAIIAQLALLTGAAGAAAPRGSATLDGELAIDYLVTFTMSRDPGDLAALDLDPEAFVTELRTLGSCIVLASPTVVPGGDGGPAHWRFLVSTRLGPAAIEDVFIFVAGGGELQIERGLAEPLFHDPPGDVARAAAPPARTPSADPARPVAVARDHLDRMAGLIGELAVAHARLEQAFAACPSDALAAPLASVGRLIAALCDGIPALGVTARGRQSTDDDPELEGPSPS